MPRPLIAVVEDDPDRLEFLQDLLNDAGYRTLLPTTAHAQLTLRRAAPDLLILDLWVGHRGAGKALLDVLAADPRTSAIPVLVCSGHVPSRGARTLLFGDREYPVLPKPFPCEDLLAMVHSLVGPMRTA